MYYQLHPWTTTVVIGASTTDTATLPAIWYYNDFLAADPIVNCKKCGRKMKESETRNCKHCANTLINGKQKKHYQKK